MKSNFQHYIGLYGHQLLLEEDSTVVSTWMAWDDSLGFRTYITKWQVFPNIDTLITKELDWKYPNTITNRPTETIRTRDGNIVSVGFIADSINPQIYFHAHIAKYDVNLNVLWETKVPCFNCPFGTGPNSVLEASDGSFVISGGIRGVVRTWISKVDSTGTVEWEHVLPLQNSENLSDGVGLIAHTPDDKIMMITHRSFNCPDFDPNCDQAFPLGRLRLIKFDWDGTFLKDTLIGPLIGITMVSSIQPIPSGGYLISAGRMGGMHNPIVFRISEEGDSIWWREPYVGDQRWDSHWSYVTKPTADGGYIGCGWKILNPNLYGTYPWGHPQAGYVFKLDSNGCYGPGDCPTSTISVVEYEEEAVLSFYPNPTQDVLNVTFSTTKQAEYHVVLRDAQGKVVLDERLSSTGTEYTKQLDLRHLAKGMYILEIQDAGKVNTTAKIIVQ